MRREAAYTLALVFFLTAVSLYALMLAVPRHAVHTRPLLEQFFDVDSISVSVYVDGRRIGKFGDPLSPLLYRLLYTLYSNGAPTRWSISGVIASPFEVCVRLSGGGWYDCATANISALESAVVVAADVTIALTAVYDSVVLYLNETPVAWVNTTIDAVRGSTLHIVFELTLPESIPAENMTTVLGSIAAGDTPLDPSLSHVYVCTATGCYDTLETALVHKTLTVNGTCTYYNTSIIAIPAAGTPPLEIKAYYNGILILDKVVAANAEIAAGIYALSLPPAQECS